ncbi:hypothetical protein Ancab_026789 [Ancistrocladus abbreviatus]
MGSLEEERLLQMVRDFIESEESSSPNSHTSKQTLPLNHSNNHFNHKTSVFNLQENLRKKTDAETELLGNVIKHMKNRTEMKKSTSLKMWLVTRLNCDGYHASLCQTSWLTRPGCPSGSYDYIEIILEENESGGVESVRLIVDLDFKSQFEVARPTASYLELSSILPTIFVGNEKKLRRIITILCSAAKESLRERGLHIPPWRTAAYMQSKWFSWCRNEPIIISPFCSSRQTSSDAEDGIKNGDSTTKFMINSKWAPEKIMKSKRKDMNDGSGLTFQFSNMSINCF